MGAHEGWKIVLAAGVLVVPLDLSDERYSLVTASAGASAPVVEPITATAASGPACRFDDHSAHYRKSVYVNIMAASSLAWETTTHKTECE